MSRSVDDLLRTTLRDLAVEPHIPADLAAGALARGRRLHRRRRVTTVAAALMFIAAAMVPYAIFQRTAAPTDPVGGAAANSVHAPAPELIRLTAPAWSRVRPYPVPGDLRVIGVGPRGSRPGPVENLVLDPATGRYRSLPASVLASSPSPDRRYAVVTDLDVPTQWGIRDLLSGHTRSLPSEVSGNATWSATGNRLLLTRATGFTIVDAATGRTVHHEVDRAQQMCDDFCGYAWLSGDTEVALPQAYRFNDHPARITGLAIFDARTGELLRNDPVAGAPVGRRSWSPDGRLVLIRPDTPGTDQVLIAEAATGQAAGGFRASSADFLDDGSILGVLGSEVTRYDAGGHPIETMVLPEALAERILTFGRG